MTFTEDFARYARHKLPHATDVRVEGVERIFGGASRVTRRLRLLYLEAGAGEGDAGRRTVDRRLIARCDPAASLIDTDREVEFAALRAFYGSAVPVPEALWLETDEQWLGSPFFVMSELAGFEAGVQAISEPPYAQHAEKLAEQKWSILGEIAKADPIALGLDEVMQVRALDAIWRGELDEWEAKLDRDAPAAQPIQKAVTRWLRRNPPPPPDRLGVVHGDYRTGNFLYDTDGNVRGILDWEMAHLGDPLEDLAWSLSRIFHWTRDDRAGGLVERARAIDIWERAAGRKADPAALHWWDLFTCVKGQAIWLAAGNEFLEGRNRDPILAMTGLVMGNSQDRAALELMEKLA